MDWTQFNWVDWAFVAVLLYGAAMGAVRGLSSELAMLVGMVVAAVVTRLFYEPVSFWICDRWGWNEEVTRLFAVVLLALLALYGMRLVRIALGALMTFSFKGLVERVGGLLALNDNLRRESGVSAPIQIESAPVAGLEAALQSTIT